MMFGSPDVRGDVFYFTDSFNVVSSWSDIWLLIYIFLSSCFCHITPAHFTIHWWCRIIWDCSETSFLCKLKPHFLIIPNLHRNSCFGRSCTILFLYFAHIKGPLTYKILCCYRDTLFILWSRVTRLAKLLGMTS